MGGWRLWSKMNKYFPHLTPGSDYLVIPEEDISKTSIYKFTITQWSAKRKEAVPDYPWAFYFDETLDKELK